MRVSRAFSLIELLIVLAVIALLAALLFPALVEAKRGAKDTVSLSNLHQLGLASGLYQQEAGVFPESAALLASGYVRDQRVFAAPNDPTPNGYARLMLGNLPGLGAYKGRLTYVGPYEVKRSDADEAHRLTNPGTTRGLLADLSPPRNATIAFSPETGRYHRLNEDLSIVSPWFSRLPIQGGTCFVGSVFLDDYDATYLRKACGSL